MASVAIEDVLGAPQLCGAYERVKTGIPDVFTPPFYTSDQKVEKDTGSYFASDGQRQLAEITAYGSASTSTQMKGLSEVPVKLYHVAKNLTVPAINLIGLIRKDSAGSNLLIDEKGVDEAMRQVKLAVARVKNLKIALLTQLLTLGNNYFDAAGLLLPSSSGAKTTSPSQIAAANLGNLTSVLSGATAWNNPAADIEDDLVHLDQLAMDNTGYNLRYAFYGRNIPKYMSGNAKMAAYLARNPAANDAYVKNSGIAPLGNLMWMPGYRSSYRDATDTTQRLIGDNQIVFTPEPDPEWIGWINGGTAVPNSIEVASDLASAMSNWGVVYGDYMYAQCCADPVSIKIVYGTTSLPTIRVPKATYTVDVTA